MAKNSNDNLISNLSYTEKDFQTIYPALLDLVAKETAKWDPSASNESDPGVLLLKLNAIIADKCNYNIDKNVLECFPVSVTQTQNARQLFEQLGYYMHWYQAASSAVTLKWIGSTPTDSDGNEITLNYTIPRFTMFCDSNSEIVYTSTLPVTLSTSGSAAYVGVVQGIAKEFTINGETKITTAALDANNRLYFEDTYIAENGIFITNDGSNYDKWERKDNLLKEELSSENRYYKFGVSQDLNTCYLEFPQNAEEIFQEGIYITYLVTNGVNGNIAAGVLETLYNSLEVTDPSSTTGATTTLTTDDISINNYMLGFGGADPETISDAYLGYKKVVGTFDTLVTLRDYMNALRNCGYASNGIVSDRTTDIQSSYDIITQTSSINQSINQVEYSQTYDKEGYYDGTDFWSDSTMTEIYDPDEDLTYIADKDTTVVDPGTTFRVFYKDGAYEYLECDPYNRPELKAFDLKMYVLATNAIINDGITTYDTDATEIEESESFNDTFTLVDDSSTLGTIETVIDSYKCVQHEFKDLLTNKICFIKAKYPINCKIVPQYSLTETEAKEVAKNVRTALYTNLNAAKIEFGYKLSYEEIYNIISDADSRIKAVALDPIVYTPYIVYLKQDTSVQNAASVLTELKITDWVTKQDEEGEYYIDWDEPINQFMKEIYAKSVLAGRTQFFVKDTEFNYGINQKYQILEENLGRLETGLTVALNKDNNWQYTVRENEVIQLYAPNLIENASYSSNIKFEYHLFNVIPGNSSYKLQPGEYIIFYWKSDSTDAGYKYAIYGNGTIIQPTFKLENSVPVASLIGNCYISKLSTLTKNNQEYDYASGDTASDQDLITDITNKVAALTDSSNILSGSKEVLILFQNSIIIDSTYDCYWILNDIKDSSYVLFDDTMTSNRILNNGEMFVYVKSNTSDYTILGAGTEILRSQIIQNDCISCQAVVDYDTFIEKGITAISEQSAWVNVTSTTLPIVEMQYMSLGEGTAIYIKPDSTPTKFTLQATDLYELRLNSKTQIDAEETYTLQDNTEDTSKKEYLVCYSPIEDSTNYTNWTITPEEWILVEDTTSKYYGKYKVSFTTQSLSQDKRLRISRVTAAYVGYIATEISEDKFGNTATIYFETAQTQTIVAKVYAKYFSVIILGPQTTIINGEYNITSSSLTSVATAYITEYGTVLDEYHCATTATSITDSKNIDIESNITKVCGAEINTSSPKTISDIIFDSSSAYSLLGCTLKYKETADAADWTDIPNVNLNDSNYAWQIRSLLRLNCAADIPQKLQSGQYITYYRWDDDKQRIVEMSHQKEYDETEWEEYWCPRTINPDVPPLSSPAYLLSSLTIDDLGPKITTVAKDENDKYVPSAIYAYIMGDKDDDILFLTDGTTQITYRKNTFQVQAKNITFKLPAGNYIMPVNHSTDNTAENKYGISLLKLYLNRKSFNNITDLTNIQFKFKDTITIWPESKVECNTCIEEMEPCSDGTKTGQASVTTDLFKANKITIKNETISYALYNKTSQTYVDTVVYTSGAWVNSRYQAIICRDNGFINDDIFESWLEPNVTASSVQEELVSMSGDTNNNLYNAGNYYLRINNLPDALEGVAKQNFFVTVTVLINYAKKHDDEKEVPSVSVLIPQIFKYNNTTWKTLDGTALSDEIGADLFVKIYEKIKALDFNHLFNYTYVVSDDIKISNPLTGESFLDENHIMNPYTICQLNTTSDDYKIQLTNVLK